MQAAQQQCLSQFVWLVNNMLYSLAVCNRLGVFFFSQLRPSDFGTVFLKVLYRPYRDDPDTCRQFPANQITVPQQSGYMIRGAIENCSSFRDADKCAELLFLYFGDHA